MKAASEKLASNRLAHYRRKLGLWPEDVAYLLGLKNSTKIDRWEAGVAMPTSKQLIHLGVIYRVNPLKLYPDNYRDALKKFQYYRKSGVL
jgi:DNA-binding transcriptional regulator YiaG